MAFFVSQILLRIPLLNQVLAKMPWYLQLAAESPYLCSLLVGLSAGIFEETARLLCFRFLMKKNRRFVDSLSFGFGHGGIEAILITGLSCLSTLQYCLMMNSGSFESLQSILPATNYVHIYQSCTSLAVGTVLLGGVERIFAMGLHIGFTTLIWKGFREKQIWRYFAVAVLLHGLIDTMSAFMTRAGWADIAIEAVLFVIAAGFTAYVIIQGKKEAAANKACSQQISEKSRLKSLQ